MATYARITPTLLATVMRRRGAGEEWKVIERDLRAAGLPCHRQQYHAALTPDTRRQRGAERARLWRNRRRNEGVGGE